MPLKLGKIHQGDCLKLMKQIDDGSVDLAFADPPFNIGYKYDKYHDSQEDAKYLDWCGEWIGEISRILKPSGTFWLAIGDEYAAELKVAATRQIAVPRHRDGTESPSPAHRERGWGEGCSWQPSLSPDTTQLPRSLPMWNDRAA